MVQKTCEQCGVRKPNSEFHKHRTGSHGTRNQCRVCLNERKRSRYGAERERQMATKNARLDRMLAEALRQQGGKCALCGKQWVPGMRRFSRDHDHSCCVNPRASERCGACERGYLCHDCNIGLGNFKDDPELLRRAIRYLARWAS